MEIADRFSSFYCDSLKRLKEVKHLGHGSPILSVDTT